MGTTLGILAPYLPYGIEVEVRYQDVAGNERGKLGSISLNGPHVRVEHEEPRMKGGVVDVILKPEECIPVLYSFEDLCTPLTDGSVPADHLAELLFERIYPFESLKMNEAKDEISIVGVEGFRKGFMKAHFLTSGHVMTVDVADYLRSKHFAVGLTPEQYIRKQA